MRGKKKQIVGIRYDFVVASPCLVDVYFPWFPFNSILLLKTQHGVTPDGVCTMKRVGKWAIHRPNNFRGIEWNNSPIYEAATGVIIRIIHYGRNWGDQHSWRRANSYRSTEQLAYPISPSDFHARSQFYAWKNMFFDGLITIITLVGETRKKKHHVPESSPIAG